MQPKLKQRVIFAIKMFFYFSLPLLAIASMVAIVIGRSLEEHFWGDTKLLLKILILSVGVALLSVVGKDDSDAE